ncbi:MAG: 50S ribosomal protein L9, partial [Gammaproteobacteria bacterium]|nr:50S ribosomal protein L9 [Gammaproteobacteria bacterium]
EKRRAELERAEAGALGAAQARADLLKELSVTITRKAGDEGRLFGSVGTGDIAEAVAATGAEIKKQEIRLPEGALRRTGEYDVAVHLHTDINVSVKVEIVAE